MHVDRRSWEAKQHPADAECDLIAVSLMTQTLASAASSVEATLNTDTEVMYVEGTMQLRDHQHHQPSLAMLQSLVFPSPGCLIQEALGHPERSRCRQSVMEAATCFGSR